MEGIRQVSVSRALPLLQNNVCSETPSVPLAQLIKDKVGGDLVSLGFGKLWEFTQQQGAQLQEALLVRLNYLSNMGIISASSIMK